MKMHKEKKSLITALLLFVCVAVSTIIVVDQMRPFLLSDKGAIPFMDNIEAMEAKKNDVPQRENVTVQNETAQNDTETESPQQSSSGMVTSDDTVVWEKETEVEIFRISYENESGEITVRSSNKDKVIAPGTNNSYVFKLKNTANSAVDYKVEMESYMESSNYDIPIKSRMSRYDGKWLVGDAKDYVELEKFHAIDEGTVAAGNFIYYTLDWMWPFEGDDEFDTMLGNLSVDEDLSFTIILRTEAVWDENPDSDGGIRPPKTGDTNQMILWITVLAVSFVIMIFMFIHRDKDEEEEESIEAETNNK